MSDLEEFDNSETTLTLSELYAKLMLHEELIITIPIEQEATVRKGLASVKAKQNAKLKDSGLQPDSASLVFQTLKSSAGEGTVDLQISLSKRNAIKIISMSLPDKDL